MISEKKFFYWRLAILTYFYVKRLQLLTLFIFLQVEPRTSVTGESSTSALITASVVTAIAALIVGYLAGFLTAKKCSKDYKSCGHHYLEHHLNKYVQFTIFHFIYSKTNANLLIFFLFSIFQNQWKCSVTKKWIWLYANTLQ